MTLIELLLHAQSEGRFTWPIDTSTGLAAAAIAQDTTITPGGQVSAEIYAYDNAEITCDHSVQVNRERYWYWKSGLIQGNYCIGFLGEHATDPDHAVTYGEWIAAGGQPAGTALIENDWI